MLSSHCMWRSACVFRHVYCYVNAKSFGHHCAINFKAAGDGCCSVQKRQLNRRDKYTVEAEKNLSDEDEAAFSELMEKQTSTTEESRTTLTLYLDLLSPMPPASCPFFGMQPLLLRASKASASLTCPPTATPGGCSQACVHRNHLFPSAAS